MTFPPTSVRSGGFTLRTSHGRARCFALTELEDLLKQAGLYQAISAVQYGILELELPLLLRCLGALESLNGHVLTLIGEMGFTLHELYEVSGLVIGDALYEEYVPTTEELHFLKKEDPQVYETY